MIDLANLIYLIPVEFVSAISGTELALKSGASLDLFLTENDVKVTDTPEVKDAGEYFSQSSKVIVSKMDGLLRKKYSRNRQVIAVFVKTKGEKLIWGSLDYPVSCAVAPLLDADQITLTRKALAPLL